MEMAGVAFDKAIPIYGNFGGPGWSGGQRGDVRPWVAPADSMDEFFMEHDYGYGRGEFRKADRELYQSLMKMPGDPRDWSTPSKTLRYADAYRKFCIVIFYLKSHLPEE
jgi:hypothetical protein